MNLLFELVLGKRFNEKKYIRCDISNSIFRGVMRIESSRVSLCFGLETVNVMND